MDGLTPGRMVHVVLGPKYFRPGQHRAAIVSEVRENGIISAHVLLMPGDIGGLQGIHGTGLEGDGPYLGLIGFMLDIPYSEEKTPDTWHWIEKA